MTLRRRLEKLEGKRGAASRGPSVIFLCEAGGEVRTVLLVGGGTLSREPGETEIDFRSRVTQGESAVWLPDNGRGHL